MGLGAPFIQQRVQGISDPLSLGNNAAIYDVSDLSSMRNNAGAIPSTGESIKLLSDKSGNSGVNVLCLNGVAGNYAGTPSTAPLSDTGDKDLIAYLIPPTWSPAASGAIISKFQATSGWIFQLRNTNVLRLYDGNTNIDANAVTGGTAFTGMWVRCRHDVDNGAGGRTTQFYTSTNYNPDTLTGSWTQIGTNVVTATALALAQNGELSLGAYTAGTLLPLLSNMGRVQVWNGFMDAGGTKVFDNDPATFTKLASTGTAITGQTVTINTSGATGARISGARDLYQGTAANQPILTIAASGNFLTFDGSNDFLKAAAFALAQPTTVYFAGSQITWTNPDNIFDGNTFSTMVLGQRGSTPSLSLYAGTSTVAANSGLPLATNAVVSCVFNAANSSLRINRTSATTGNPGSVAANGFTLGAIGDGAGSWSNITASEVVVRSVADGTAVQDSLILYLGRKYNIAV